MDITTTFLSVALLIVGLISTLSAFGGKTWKEGAGPILERITSRGWISLVCLTLALSLGVIKEVVTATKAASDKAATAAAAANRDKQHSEEQAYLKDQLDKAEAELKGLKETNSEMKQHLDDQGETLGDVRGNLVQARNDLSLQSSADLLTALAHGKETVKEVWLDLPLTSEATNSLKFHEALLPRFHKASCQDLIGATVLLATGADQSVTLQYAADDNMPGHKYTRMEHSSADGMARYVGYKELIFELLDQRSSNGVSYWAAVRFSSRFQIAAADYYAGLVKPGSLAFEISMQWPSRFSTLKSYKVAYEKYPEIFNDDNIPGPDEDVLPPVNIDLSEWGPIKATPLPSCLSEGRRYFEKAFQKASLTLVLDGPNNEIIAFKLRARTPILRDGVWTVGFEPYAAPIVNVATRRMLELMNGPFVQTVKPATNQ